MSVDVKGLQFEPSQSVSIKVWNGTGGESLSSSGQNYAIDHREHGLMVEWFEPNPPSSQVRHVRFVPYSALVSISQDYVA